MRMRPRPGPAIAAAVGIATLCGLAWYFAVGRPPADEDGARTGMPVSSPGAPGQAGFPHGVATPVQDANATGAPLPGVGVPLRLIADDLRRRALAGDARAACRLAAEHDYCEQLRTTAGVAATTVRRLDSGSANQNQIQALELARHRLDSATRELAHCDGAPGVSLRERIGYWRQAAIAGHVPALRHYATGAVFRFDGFLDVLPQLEVYRNEAEGLARRAAMAGDEGTMLALAHAYTPERTGIGGSLLEQAVRPDPRAALSWYLVLAKRPGREESPAPPVMRGTVEENLQRLLEQTSAEDLEAAQAFAADRAIHWPATSRRPPVEFAMVGGGVDPRADCAAGAFIP